MHVIAVLWAFNFAGVLEGDFAEAVCHVLRVVGQTMDRSCGRAYVEMLQFPESRLAGPEVPHVELDIDGMMVIYKPPGWEVDTTDIGDARRLSRYLQSLYAWPPRSIAFDAVH